MKMQTMTRLALFAAMASLPLAACSTTEKAATAVQSAAEAQTTPTLSTTDATFLNTVGEAGLAEVQFGQLAETKATRATTRNFARRMVTEHEKANDALAQLAQSKQFTPPTSLNTANSQTLQMLQSTRGRAFDKAYLDDQVQAHQQVVQAFQNEAQNGTDPQVKAFAQQNLPLMEQHLSMAHRLDPAG